MYDVGEAWNYDRPTITDLPENDVFSPVESESTTPAVYNHPTTFSKIRKLFELNNAELGQQDIGGDAIVANIDDYTVTNGKLKVHVVERVVTPHNPTKFPLTLDETGVGVYRDGDVLKYRAVAEQERRQDITIADISKITPEQAREAGEDYSDFEFDYVYTFRSPLWYSFSNAQWEANLKLALQELIEAVEEHAEADPSRDTADFIGKNLISLDFEGGEAIEFEALEPDWNPPPFTNTDTLTIIVSIPELSS